MGDSQYTLYDCDRCGFTYKKDELLQQKGLLVCEECYDEPDPQQAGDRGE